MILKCLLGGVKKSRSFLGMDDVTEIVLDLNKIVSIQNGMIESLTLKLLEYTELDEIERLCEGKEEVQRLSEKWQP